MSEPKKLRILPGCSEHERGDWYIGPVGVHRDSDVVDRCNWEYVTAAFLALDPEANDHEIYRFGHWAVGWIEEIAYRPGSRIASLAADIRARLESYPILDEHRLAEMEYEEECHGS